MTPAAHVAKLGPPLPFQKSKSFSANWTTRLLSWRQSIGSIESGGDTRLGANTIVIACGVIEFWSSWRQTS